MRKTGLFLTAVGFSGFLIGASGIDGQTVAGNMAMTIICGVVTIAGYRIVCRASKKARLVRMQKNNIRSIAGEKKRKIRKNKNQTWQAWVSAGTIEGKESA